MDAVVCPGCSRRLRPARDADEVRCPICGTIFTPPPPAPLAPAAVSLPDERPAPCAPSPATSPPWWWRWAMVLLFLAGWGLVIFGILWATRSLPGEDTRSNAELWELVADGLLKHAGPPSEPEWRMFDQFVQAMPSRLAPFVRGTLLARAERYREADAAFAEGMANPPAADISRFDLYRTRSRYYAGDDVLAIYDSIGPGAFDPLCEALKLDGDDETLEKLVARSVAVEGLDARRQRERAEMYARMGRADEAMADIAVARESPSVVRSLARAGKAVEAYRKVPRDWVFRGAAESLTLPEAKDDLRRLIAVRRADAPDHAEVAYQEGRLHQQEGNEAEAAVCFFKALKGGRNEKGAVAEDLLPMARLGQGTVGWRRLGRRREHVPELINALRVAGAGAELERLSSHLRHESGETEVTIAAEVVAKLLQNQPERALALYRRERRRLETGLRGVSGAFLRAGLEVEWYRSEIDRVAAFAALSPDHSVRLLEAHALQHPDDPRLHLAWGQLYLRRKDYAQAGASFQRALTSKNEDERLEAEDGRRRALVLLGRTAEAINAILDRPDALDEIARACVEHARPDQLAVLIAAPRPRRGPTPERWLIADDWLRARHDSVVGRFRDAGRAIHVELQRMPEVGRWYVGSLRALGRGKEADAEERRLAKRGRGEEGEGH